MKATCRLLLFIVPVIVLGCNPPPADTSKEDEKIKTNLAKLDPDDRKLAEEQKFCAVQTNNRLGEMGEPQKVEINGEPVFLCCKSCKKEALADPDKTLAKVKELRAQSKAGK